jgi:hypothetical protein
LKPILHGEATLGIAASTHTRLQPIPAFRLSRCISFAFGFFGFVPFAFDFSGFASFTFELLGLEGVWLYVIGSRRW